MPKVGATYICCCYIHLREWYWAKGGTAVASSFLASVDNQNDLTLTRKSTFTNAYIHIFNSQIETPTQMVNCFDSCRRPQGLVIKLTEACQVHNAIKTVIKSTFQMSSHMCRRLMATHNVKSVLSLTCFLCGFLKDPRQIKYNTGEISH